MPPAQTQPPTIAAIVPATDDPPTLARALRAIADGTDVPETVTPVRTAPGPGPAAARNAGAAGADADVLLFVDADVVLGRDAVERVRRRFGSPSPPAALFGAYDHDPEDPGLVSRFRNLLHHHVHAGAAGPAGTFWAGVGAISRSEFERIGGFDAERFPRASVEDIELGARLTAAGGRIELDPAIAGTHLKRWTLRSMIATDLIRRGVPWASLALEGRAPRGGLNLSARHRVSAAASVALVAAALARRRRAALAAGSVILLANRGFYALLARHGGVALAAAGPPLHVVHHLTSALAVAVALLRPSSARSSRP